MARAILVTFVVLTCAAGAVQAGNPVLLNAIGQIVASGASLDGVPVPSGTTLFNGSSLQTHTQPVTVRLMTGDLLQVGGNSRAYFESRGNGEVQVAVKSGTMSFRVANQTVTTASPASLSFPQRKTGLATMPSGTTVLLAQKAPKGSIQILVNDASRLNTEGRTMLRSRDGTIQEVHYLHSINNNVLTLTSPLEHDYMPEDFVLQGCECDEALGTPADGIVATLSQPVAKGTNTLTISTIGFFDPQSPTLIKRRDGAIQEVHKIAAFSGNTLVFDGDLKYSYMPGDVLIQGCKVPPLGSTPFFSPLLIGGASGAAAAAGVYSTLGSESGCDCSRDCPCNIYCPCAQAK